MEEVVLRKLDEMFRDLREEIAIKHLQKVHQLPQQHHENCLSASAASVSRRHSLPAHGLGQRDSLSVKSANTTSSVARRGSLPFNADSKQTNRRSSLPAFVHSRQGTKSSETQWQQTQGTRRDSTSSNSYNQQRKFSRDSIDLNLVEEDLDETDLDADRIDNSVILEEDEADVDYEVQHFPSSYVFCLFSFKLFQFPNKVIHVSDVYHNTYYVMEDETLLRFYV